MALGARTPRVGARSPAGRGREQRSPRGTRGQGTSGHCIEHRRDQQTLGADLFCLIIRMFSICAAKSSLSNPSATRNFFAWLSICR